MFLHNFGILSKCSVSDQLDIMKLGRKEVEREEGGGAGCGSLDLKICCNYSRTLLARTPLEPRKYV